MQNNTWEHFHHEADIGIRGMGTGKEEAFGQAVSALTAVIADLDTVQPLHEVIVSCGPAEDDYLFYDFMNEVIYQMSTRSMLFAKSRVRISKHGLKATLWGEAIDPKRHDPAVEIKAASFNQLKVEMKNGGWVAQCVVDV